VSIAATFAPIDFDRYHSAELAALLPARRALALDATEGLGSLALRLRDGGAFTYRRRDGGIEIVRGDDSADTVIELDRESWQGLVHELEAPAGLLYAGRVRCLRGQAIDLMAWEPGLRALYNGRAPYDPARLDLRDRHGRPLDVSAFVHGDDLERWRTSSEPPAISSYAACLSRRGDRRLPLGGRRAPVRGSQETTFRGGERTPAATRCSVA
jgi:hypothetical protein